MALMFRLRRNKESPNVCVGGVADGEGNDSALRLHNPASARLLDLEPDNFMRDGSGTQRVLEDGVADCEYGRDVGLRGLAQAGMHDEWDLTFDMSGGPKDA